MRLPSAPLTLCNSTIRMLIASMQSARPRGASAVRDGRNIPQSRGSVLRRCSSAGSPNAPQQQPSKAAPKPSRAGLVSIAGDLHLRIDAINVHLTASALAQPGQQGLATTLQSAVMDAATSAIAASLAAPSGEPAPITPVSPFTCIGEVQSSAVNALAMCSDGHHLICGCETGEVELWDVRKPGQRVIVDICKSSTIQSVAVSADCGRVVAGADNGLWLWDVAQGKVTALLGGDIEEVEEHMDVSSVAITPDGRYGVSGGYYQGVRVWDLEKGECMGSVDASGRALYVVISPDGQTATAVVQPSDGSEDDSGADGHQVWRWHAGSGFSEPVKLQGCPQEAEDGRRAVLHTVKGSLSVWDAEGKACLATLRDHMGGGVNHLAISADGRHAVSYTYGAYRLCVWHLG